MVNAGRKRIIISANYSADKWKISVIFDIKCEFQRLLHFNNVLEF